MIGEAHVQISGRRAAREAALLILFAVDASKLADTDESIADFPRALPRRQ